MVLHTHTFLGGQDILFFAPDFCKPSSQNSKASSSDWFHLEIQSKKNNNQKH
jgi:hypothetical protein